MLRILIAAIVLLAAAWFYLDQGGEQERPLETQQQALEKAVQVEKTMQERTENLQKAVNEQTGSDE